MVLSSLAKKDEVTLTLPEIALRILLAIETQCININQTDLIHQQSSIQVALDEDFHKVIERLLIQYVLLFTVRSIL